MLVYEVLLNNNVHDIISNIINLVRNNSLLINIRNREYSTKNLIYICRVLDYIVVIC